MSETNKMDKLILNGQNIDLSPDYQNIRNKPKINGVTVDGNKTLDDFGVATKQEVENVSKEVAKLPYGIYYGQYDDIENLPDVSQLTQKGYAYVASSDPNVFYIYTYDGESDIWQDSGNKFDSGSLENNLSTKSQTKAPTTKAVQEGIEAIDVTLARSIEDENELTETQKFNASSNINDRGADVVQGTGEINSLGYKILNPNKSFASQVTASNTIYEIRDKFDLGNSNAVALPNILQKGDELNLSTSIEVLSGEKVIAPTGCKIVNNNKDSYIGNNNVFENTGSDTTVFVEADTELDTPTITVIKELEGAKTTSSETTSIDETVYNLTESITLNAGDTLATSTEGAVIINSSKDSVMTMPLTAVEDNTILYIGFVGIDEVSYTISKTIIKSCSLAFTLINVKTYNKSEAIVLSGKANIKVTDDTFIVRSDNMIIAKKTTYRNYSNNTESVFLINENATTTTYITRGNVTIPSNCTLKFNGGKIINATINSDDIKIESNKNKIFDNVGFNGYCTKKFYKLEWFVDKYTKKVNTAPSVCAASQIEEALESGVFNLTIGRDRYYPLTRTVEYVGVCNIFEETLANIRGFSESRYEDYKLPCIYSNDVVTLINYIFKDISLSGRESQSLNLRGLSLLCNKAYSDLSQKDVPLLKVTAKTPIWGLTIDAIIKNTDCNIVIDEVDNGHYIEGATVHKMYIPNYTGIKLVTNGGYMTNVTINGDMSGLYRGISVEHGPNASDWMTAININASTNCATGADLQGYFAPCIITNQHQTRLCFKQNNKVPYFQAGGIDMQGFVYDLNLPQNGVSRAELAFKVNNDNENGALVSFIKGNQTESAEVSYPIYTGDIGQFIKKNGVDLLGKSTNLLYKSLNSNSSPAITNMSYKVSVGDTQVNVFHQSGETTFYTLTNAVNIFAPNLMAIQHDQVSNMSLSDNASFTLKDAYKNSKLNFSLSFTVKLPNIGITENSCILLRFPLTCTNIKIVVNSKEYTLGSNSLYYYKSIYCLPLSVTSTVSITWTYKRSTSNTVQNALFPFIYIPMLSDSKYQFYEGWYLPKGRNTYSRFFFRSTASGGGNAALNRHRFASIIGDGTYDSDGYEYKAKIGSSTSRPTFDNDNENIGYSYFDTTLGKPIFWNGEAWIDSNGETIGLQVKDTTILLEASNPSSKTINVYSSSAITATAQNPDGSTTDLWLTASVGTLTSGAYPVTLTANGANSTNPRGAKVIISNGTDVIIVNVVQNYV